MSGVNENRTKVEKFIGRSIPDDQWAALNLWWEAIEGLPLDRQKMLWRSATESAEWTRAQTRAETRSATLDEVERLLKGLR